MKPTIVAIVIFTLVAFGQLLRVVLGWAVTVNGVFIPLWASGIVCAIAATLAVTLWREKRK